jgi:uncharacterized SAM-binding protein YcdF (DUF218 family)
VVLDVVTALVFVLFCLGVVSDPRRFANAVLLGLLLAFFGLDLLHRLATLAAEHHPAPILLKAGVALVALLLALAVFSLAFLLVANGAQLVRREGLRPVNLLSLLAGVSILGCVVILSAALATRARPAVAMAGAVLPIVGYVAFLFLCFLGYAFLYGRLPARRKVDFVVVLGSGLIGGSRVPPLLAARLDRGRGLYTRQAARGAPPLLITSGGQGRDEDLPEATAMAEYLVSRGVPPDHVLQEARSRTTEENLRFSHAMMRERKPDYRCLVVTNNFHVFRAALTARQESVRGQVIGAPTAAYFWPNATIREFAAIFLHHKVVNLGLCALLSLSGLLAAS